MSIITTVLENASKFTGHETKREFMKIFLGLSYIKPTEGGLSKIYLDAMTIIKKVQKMEKTIQELQQANKEMELLLKANASLERIEERLKDVPTVKPRRNLSTETTSGVPSHYRGWRVYKQHYSYKLVKRLSGRPRIIFIGKNWNQEKATLKIDAMLQRLKIDNYEENPQRGRAPLKQKPTHEN